jgi:hypothetical protein
MRSVQPCPRANTSVTSAPSPLHGARRKGYKAITFARAPLFPPMPPGARCPSRPTATPAPSGCIGPLGRKPSKDDETYA